MLIIILLSLQIASAQMLMQASNTTIIPILSNGTASNTSNVPIDPQQPPGQLVMQIPSLTSSKALYKIGSNISFSWTYTNLIVMPMQLNIEFYTQDSKRWVLGAYNLSGSITNYTWNSGTASPPLSNGQYVVWIYDERGRLAMTQPGYLLPFSSLQIAMYLSQPYQPLDSSENTCFACSEASLTCVHTVLLIIVLIVSIVSLRL